MSRFEEEATSFLRVQYLIQDSSVPPRYWAEFIFVVRSLPSCACVRFARWRCRCCFEDTKKPRRKLAMFEDPFHGLWRKCQTWALLSMPGVLTTLTVLLFTRSPRFFVCVEGRAFLFSPRVDFCPFVAREAGAFLMSSVAGHQVNG